MRILMWKRAGRLEPGQIYDSPGDVAHYHGLALIRAGKAEQVFAAPAPAEEPAKPAKTKGRRK